MALSSEQRKILNRIKTVGRQVGASPKEIKAAIETGLVESNLRNLPGGDRDSAGWRQERASLYKDPTNVDASIRRFFSETRAVKGKYGSAGDLAAAVQRPAAQYRGRYQQRSAEADRLMGGAGRGGGGGGTIPGVSPMPKKLSLVDTAPTRQAMLGQYLEMRGKPGALLSLGAGLGDLEQFDRDQKRNILMTPDAPPRQRMMAGASQSRPGGRAGQFKITGPNPGRLKPQLVSFAKRVAGEYGKTIVGSDGTGHSYRTVNGNVSDHSSGRATDIPATGRELLRIGRAALIAAGMPRSQAMKQRGGLYNVGGHQIIFATNQGGNHFDHVHISAR